MVYSSRSKVDTCDFQKYNIAQGSVAYKLKYDHIIEERSYDIENELIGEGYTIHFEDLIPVSVNIYNYVIIVSK